MVAPPVFKYRGQYVYYYYFVGWWAQVDRKGNNIWQTDEHSKMVEWRKETEQN